jgi:hypothetical protein
VRYTLSPALERFGLEKRPGEDETVSQMRPRLLGWLADEGHDSSLVDYATSLFDAYLEGTQSVDPEMVAVSVGLACRNGARSRFDTCRNRFEQAETPAEREHFLSALGSFWDPTLSEEALRYALTGPLRPQEVFDIPMGIAERSEAHSDLIFHWLIDHYDEAAAKLPPMYRAFLPMIAGGCSRSRLEAARAFFSEPEHATPGAEQRLARVADAVNDCASLRDREGARVATYLARVAAQEHTERGMGGTVRVGGK